MSGGPPPRQYNLVAPKGPARPLPRYLLRTVEGGTVWLYRGRELEISPGPRSSWWAEIRVIEPATRDQMQAAGVQSDLAGLGPAPDHDAALKYAVFTVDAHERLAEGVPGLTAAAGAVGIAIEELTRHRQPDRAKPVAAPTRAQVARTIELYRRKGHHSDEVAAFMRLPQHQRIELIDEMLDVARAWGGRYPNPDPALKASLLS